MILNNCAGLEKPLEKSPLVNIGNRDRATLRRLANTVAALAARPGEQEKRQLWYRHNALERTRPLVLVFPENGWIELLPPDSLTCDHPLLRTWELALRKEIFWANNIRDDRVITANFDLPYVYKETGWGLKTKRIGGEDRSAYTWDAPLRSYDDFDKLRLSEYIVDYETTRQHEELAQQLFGDLLTIRMGNEFYWTVGLTWPLVDLRGLEQVMYDMIDEPDNLHRLMAFMRDGHLAKLDYLEEHELLRLNNDETYVGSGGFGWTHELPGPDFDGHVTSQHRWGFAESQETVGISPAMFAEFIFPYQRPLLERFGLNCYGCCEPLDQRWPIVQDVPRLRRVSVSPWSNRALMADYLTDQYIYSMKPHPGVVAFSHFDEDEIRQDLRQDLLTTRDCHVEIILKDTQTFHNDPRRPGRWVEMARAEIASF